MREEWIKTQGKTSCLFMFHLTFLCPPSRSCPVCSLLIYLPSSTIWKFLKFRTQALTWCWQAMLLYAHVVSVPVCVPVNKQTYLCVSACECGCPGVQATRKPTSCVTSGSALSTLHFLQGPHVLPTKFILSGLATGNRGLTSATSQEVSEQMFRAETRGLVSL